MKSDPYEVMHETKDLAVKIARERGHSAMPVLVVMSAWMICTALMAAAEAVVKVIDEKDKQ